jgi:formylmethanofuran dehydrogenase subunit E
MKPKLWVIDNFIIFGKIECHHCGSNVELFNTETPDYETRILCKDCLKEIPTYDEYMDKQLKKGILNEF